MLELENVSGVNTGVGGVLVLLVGSTFRGKVGFLNKKANGQRFFFVAVAVVDVDDDVDGDGVGN